MCVSCKDEENKTRLEYLTYNLSNVKSDDKKAKIVRNIIEDVEFFYQKTDSVSKSSDERKIKNH